ncbi:MULTISPECIES: DUF6389 family protein [Streptomyces]|uniref:Uncharacterized protein n=1 Tax=Streptomyces badius TaxID=1941 RepID=A0ABQ2STT9_STRBA|nr:MULTISPECIES: DUF6389 family protein [Streptomyces]GGS37860.1 hypothetical protein GCM10010253_09240 [Streptomyces badius]
MFGSELRRVLDVASPSAVRRLEMIRDSATAQPDSVTIDVFPDQEGDGACTVSARFGGGQTAARDWTCCAGRTPASPAPLGHARLGRRGVCAGLRSFARSVSVTQW